MSENNVSFIFGVIIGAVIMTVVLFIIQDKIEADIYKKGIEAGVVEKYIDGNSIKYRFIKKENK